MTTLTTTAYKQAQDVVRQCISPIGLRASALDSGYPQVWARDSMITLLGACQVEGKAMQTALRQCLVTLQEHQTDQGAIPANVGVHGGRTDFRSYIDGGLWHIIGHHAYYQAYGDKDFLADSWPRLEKTLQWLLAQDVYQKNLIAMQEGSDWMDMVALRGLGLCTNVLYFRALTVAAELADVLGHSGRAAAHRAKAGLVREALQHNFWVDMAELCTKGVTGQFENEEWDIIWGKKLAVVRERPYFLPYLAFRDLGTWCDTLGNLLAIIYGVATPKQSAQILEYMKQVGIAGPHPAKAIHPVIYPGDPDWREYYLNRNLNLPNQYHNGGIWGFVGGFYVAALVKHGDLAAAETALGLLAEAGRKGRQQEWEFNEWHHGLTGEPMGQPLQAWSASMYLFAHRSVEVGQVPFVDEPVPTAV